MGSDCKNIFVTGSSHLLSFAKFLKYSSHSSMSSSSLIGSGKMVNAVDCPLMAFILATVVSGFFGYFLNGMMILSGWTMIPSGVVVSLRRGCSIRSNLGGSHVFGVFSMEFTFKSVFSLRGL
jgi:hypothetical protein